MAIAWDMWETHIFFGDHDVLIDVKVIVIYRDAQRRMTFTVEVAEETMTAGFSRVADVE